MNNFLLGLQLLFITLKLLNVLSWNWLIILIPLGIYFLPLVLSLTGLTIVYLVFFYESKDAKKAWNDFSLWLITRSK